MVVVKMTILLYQPAFPHFFKFTGFTFSEIMTSMYSATALSGRLIVSPGAGKCEPGMCQLES